MVWWQESEERSRLAVSRSMAEADIEVHTVEVTWTCRLDYSFVSCLGGLVSGSFFE